MESVIQPARAPVPTMPSALASRLPWVVMLATIAAAIVCVATIEFADRPDWWRGFTAASVVAVSGAVASIAILSKLSGVRMDTAINFFMGATGARMAISLIGLIVAVKGFHTPAEPTGFMICGYYAATLLAETFMIARCTRGAGCPSGVQDIGVRNA